MDSLQEFAAHYDALTAKFDKHSTFQRGGQNLTHVTGEQVITRLNQIYGPEGWNFTIKSQGTLGPEAWVIGQLNINEKNFAGAPPCLKEQFGTQELQRGSRDNTDVFKAAATDALKKCASELGIGLYLFNEEERQVVEADMRANGQAPAASSPRSGGYSNSYNQNTNRGPVTSANTGGPSVACQACGGPIEGTTFKDRQTGQEEFRSPEVVRSWGRKNFNLDLCLEHYSKAKKDPSFLASIQSSAGNSDEDDQVPF